MVEIILVRHARTEGNDAGVFESDEGRLSARGRQQARKLAVRLKSKRFDAVYSSPFRRTMETAEIIMRYHKGMKITCHPDLREGDIGSFVGKRLDSVDWKRMPPDVESFSKVRKRADKLLKMICAKHKGQRVLLVGHNGINSAIIGAVMGIPGSSKTPCKQENTCVNMIKMDKDNILKIHLLNCTRHLH